MYIFKEISAASLRFPDVALGYNKLLLLLLQYVILKSGACLLYCRDLIFSFITAIIKQQGMDIIECLKSAWHLIKSIFHILSNLVKIDNFIINDGKTFYVIDIWLFCVFIHI